jgi:hypothetical protein
LAAEDAARRAGVAGGNQVVLSVATV